MNIPFDGVRRVNRYARDHRYGFANFCRWHRRVIGALALPLGLCACADDAHSASETSRRKDTTRHVGGEHAAAPSDSRLPASCERLVEMSALAYTDDHVATLLDAARACAEEEALIGSERDFIQTHFPAPTQGGMRKDAHLYYAGDWKSHSGTTGAAKQVKLLFCFGEAGRVVEVRHAYAHQDLACP